MAESKISNKYAVNTLVVDGTTDAAGDITINLDCNQYVPLSARPNRNAGSGYYNSWYNVLLNGATSAASGNAVNYYSSKIVSDNLQALSNTKVKFTVYYQNI